MWYSYEGEQELMGKGMERIAREENEEIEPHSSMSFKQKGKWVPKCK